MAGSNIPDIASDPEKGILKVASSQLSSLIIGYNFLSSDLGSLIRVASREVPIRLG